MNNDLFIKLYNDIENQIILKYSLPENYQGAFSYYTKKVEKNREKRVKLDQVRRLRNFLVHEDTVKDYEMFYITDDLILFLKEILYQLVDPLKAFDICVKKEQMVTATMQDLIQKTMLKMHESGFSHVPVLDENERVVGIFSESTMFSYLLHQNGKVTIEPESVILQYQPYICLDQHSSERYCFVSRNTEVLQVVRLFKQYEKEAKKLKMILVTENGKEDEKLLGIITPLDILKI